MTIASTAAPSSGSQRSASVRFSLRLVLEDDKLACKRRVCFWIALEENATSILPELFPREWPLPWAPLTVRNNTAVCQEGGDLAHGSACAKVANASTSRDAGTSATARIRNASGKSAAGRRLTARPDAARTPWSRPATPRTRNSAASEPKSRPKPLRTRTLRRAWSRTRKFFPLPICDRPGCYQPPVSSLRNPARYCCAACRQAVHNVLDRERKWLARGTLDGRNKRAIADQAARRNRSRHPQTPAADRTPRPPPQ